jgi:GH24 family phage-related lysozyme (muramidase)
MVHHEGLRLRPYLCPAQIWTVGVGSVLHQEQIRLPMIKKEGYTGMIRKEFPLGSEHDRQWSKDEVMELFSRDLAVFERGVLKMCHGELTQGQFDALVSFSFNVGLGNLQRSTIRMKHNRGDFEGAAEAFMAWTKAGGRELPGLVKRRTDERNLYLS